MADQFSILDGKLVRTKTVEEQDEYSPDDLRERIASATTRIASINEDLALLTAEKSEYETLLAKYEELSS